LARSAVGKAGPATSLHSPPPVRGHAMPTRPTQEHRVVDFVWFLISRHTFCQNRRTHATAANHSILGSFAARAATKFEFFKTKVMSEQGSFWCGRNSSRVIVLFPKRPFNISIVNDFRLVINAYVSQGILRTPKPDLDAISRRGPALSNSAAISRKMT